MDQSTPEYRLAFREYLRRGTPIGLYLRLMQQQEQKREIEWLIKSQKRWPNQDKVRSQPKPTTHYIWRTRGDNKVRSRHAANDGKVFAWDNPPPTGHPGEDYNCRCIAEPYYPDNSTINEHLSLTMSGISDSGRKWKYGTYSGIAQGARRLLQSGDFEQEARKVSDFLGRYLDGIGGTVRLRNTGHLRRVVDEYQRQVRARLLGQIADRARYLTGRTFRFRVEQTYEMQHIVFDLGKTTIIGEIDGHSWLDRNIPGALNVSGKINFTLKDAFTDPYDLVDLFDGTWDPDGVPYKIEDHWQGVFSGQISASRHSSRYKYNSPPDYGDPFP